MHPLSQFATEVAPQVDRLVLTVHRQMRAVHEDAIHTWRSDSGLARPGLIINLRPFFLAGTQSRILLERLHRYALPTTLDEHVAAAIAQGLVDEALAPSASCLELANRLTTLQSSLIDELWGGQPALAELLEPLGAAVDGVPERYSGPAFILSRAWTELPRPAGTPAYLIHHLLTALRYLRADAHTVVIDAAGLTPGEAARLDAAWRQLEGTHHEHPLDGLVSHGYLDVAGDLTKDGRRARQAIEDETNSVAGAVWEAVGADHMPKVIADLATLPDHLGLTHLGS